MTIPASVAALDVWIGHMCEEISRREYDWSFQFGSAGGVSASCPWRIIAADRIAHADTDDGQIFGLPKAVDGVEKSTSLLSGKKIVSIEVSPVSGDLRIHFDGQTILELFNNSSGYEGWHAIAKIGSQRIELVAQGGGQLAIWNG